MADGTAPAIDKVGASVPMVSELAVAPGVVNAPSLAVCPPNPERLEGNSDQPSGPGKDGKTNRLGVGPKPVEVTSEPQTPANPTSSAVGTPRPELTIHEEPTLSAKALNEPVVMVEAAKLQPIAKAEMPENDDARPEAATGKAAAPNGAHKPTPTSFEKKSSSSIAPPASASAPEYGMAEPATEPAAPAAGRKRKLEDIARDTSLSAETEGLVAGEKTTDKRVKVDTAAHRNGRPKKDQNPSPVVGKTAFKTRSQGPVDT